MKPDQIANAISTNRTKLIYAFAVVSVVAAIALYFTNDQPTNSGLGNTSSSFSLSLTSASSSQINVNEQILSLPVKNILIQQEKILNNVYIVTYKYQITNTYAEPIVLNSSVSYFLQQERQADIKNIYSFITPNKKFKKSSRFDGVDNSRLSESPFTLMAGKTLVIELSAQVFMIGTTPPVRNVIEFSGKGQTTQKDYAGTSVAIFYPGIVITEESLN